jgi:hypothetical protein
LLILLLGVDHRLLRPDLVIRVAQALGDFRRQAPVLVELGLVLELLATLAYLGDPLFSCLDRSCRGPARRGYASTSISFSLP